MLGDRRFDRQAELPPRYERIVRHVIAQWRCLGCAHADTGTRDHIPCSARPTRFQVQILAIAQIRTIVPHVYVERPAEFRRPVGQLRIRQAVPAFAHEVDARDGRYGPDEHASRHTARLGHHVQASVLAGPKDIRVSGRTEEHLRALRSTAIGMGGGVAFGEIGFRLDNTSRNGSVDQDRPEQIPGYVAGVSTEKSAVQPKGLRPAAARIRLLRVSI